MSDLDPRTTADYWDAYLGSVQPDSDALHCRITN